jgi:hypothetical protein
MQPPPRHFHIAVWDFLDRKCLWKWIGRSCSVTGLPRFPKLTASYFSSGSKYGCRFYVSPLSTTLLRIYARKNAAAAKVTTAVLTKVWTELEYRHDMRRLTSLSSLNICKLVSVGHKHSIHVTY